MKGMWDDEVVYRSPRRGRRAVAVAVGVVVLFVLVLVAGGLTYLTEASNDALPA